MGQAAIPYLMIGGTVLSTVNEQRNLSAQEDAAKAQANIQNAQLQLEVTREQTQASIEAASRERKLARALASQRAAFGGIVDASSGSPQRLQENTIGSINREQGFADLESGQRVANLNAEQANVNVGLTAKKNSIRFKKTASLLDAGTKVTPELSKIYEARKAKQN